MSSFKNFLRLAIFFTVVGSLANTQGLAAEKDGLAAPFQSFREVDADHDGGISISEAEAYQGKVFAAFDADKNSSLTVVEFLGERLGAVAFGFFASETLDIKKDRFQLWDRNGDGVLSRAEFVAGGLGGFARADKNGDSKLDENEFKARLAM